MFVHQPAMNSVMEITPRDSQGRLRLHISGGGAIPRKPVGNLIAPHPSVPRDPKEPHGTPHGDNIQCLLTLANQWGRCFDGPECLQSRQTVRANTYVIPWYFLSLDLMCTGQNGEHCSLKYR